VKDFIPKLRLFLDHEDEHVRSHAGWAVEKLEGPP
jgi:hypothetical protein